MITNLVNPALKLPFGTASATLTFNTDGAAPFQISVTSSAENNNFNVASSAGIAGGDFYSIAGGASNGIDPWVTVSNGLQSATLVNCPLPSVRTAVTNAVGTRYERFETRFRAKKVTLTNLTNGDVHVWDPTLRDDQAVKTPSGGSPTTLTNSAILNRSNCIAIHPNLLPVNCSFTLKCDYDYYS